MNDPESKMIKLSLKKRQANYDSVRLLSVGIRLDIESPRYRLEMSPERGRKKQTVEHLPLQDWPSQYDVPHRKN